jgi:hypothetical protein
MGSLVSFVQDKFLGGAEKKAGKVQEAAGREALEQEQMSLEEQRQQAALAREQLMPFQQAGLRALQQQEALTGTLGEEEQQRAFQAFTESPGQRFLRERQEQSLLRNQAAIGGLGGGNVRTALQQQAMGFAQQDLSDQLARLAGLSGMGRQAAGGVAEMQLGLGSALASGRARIGGGLRDIGSAQASGILGEAAQHRAAQEQFYQRGKDMFEGISGGMSGGMGGGM